MTSTARHATPPATTPAGIPPTDLARRLLGWYRRRARDLPWRRSRDPYQVWVSEIMLQQTQVATVIPYFERFVARFPTLTALAAADEQQVLRVWEGLGYYRRARQLHRAARVVVAEHAGRFPRRVDAVRRLPGIGRYTAGAILSIAFDLRHPILEANTVRLLARLLAYRGLVETAGGQKLLWDTAAAWLPRRAVGTFNQALMELGSQVCLPRAPLCSACPLADLCPTRRLGLADAIPAQRKRPPSEAVREAAVSVWRRGRVLLVQRQAHERWGGLWDFPRFAVEHRQGAGLADELRTKVATLSGLAIEPGPLRATLRHGVTRFRITLDCYDAKALSGRARGLADGTAQWVAPADLAHIPLCVTGRKLAELIAAAAPRGKARRQTAARSHAGA